jgi:asparagine synthase (glutamine-hydrolysing)
MTSRGPDDAGVWSDAEVALGHRRLAVIDLSAAGRQPMARGGIHVVFNGEIYNYRRLRAELESEGLRFESDSDTEVLPLGLRQWGFRKLLEKLDGMFSFALWDANNRQMYLARDRAGEKPLYYSLSEHVLAAGSDIKAVAGALPSAPALQDGILPLYLYHGFIPAPWTIYKNVSKLPPATAMVVSVRDGTLLSEQFTYWQLRYDSKAVLRYEEAVEELDALLREAVSERLVADVPVGAFLSGGVDSSAVVSYAAELAPRIKTFSIGFSHETHNELPFARQVAEHWNTEHYEEILSVDVLAELPRILWNHGEPFADSSAVPSHAVAEVARRHVTVVLSGDGGDEAFAGYPNARASWLAGYYKGAVAEKWRYRADRFLTALCSGRNVPAPLSRAWTLVRYGTGPVYLEPDLWRDDLRGALLTTEAKRKSVLSPRGWHSLAAGRVAAVSNLDRYLGLDMQARLPNDYLTKVDVATMAVGLEARTPFLAPKVLEFAARLPRRLLLPGGESKGLLKSVAARRVPAGVIYRKKQGFALPLGDWMRTAYRSQIESTLLSPLAMERGFFNPDAVRKTIGEHMAGRFDHAGRLWTLLVWESWCRMFLDGASPEGVLREAWARS